MNKCHGLYLRSNPFAFQKEISENWSGLFYMWSRIYDCIRDTSRFVQTKLKPRMLITI